MSESRLMSVGGLADRLADITGNSSAYHARQLRGLVRERALQPKTYGGEGPTAAALFSERELCLAMILHTLTSLNLQFEFLKRVAKLTANLDEGIGDSAVRKPGVMEPSDALEFAVTRIRKGEKFYLHVAFPEWPFDELFGDVRGYISNSREVDDTAHDVDGNECEPVEPKRAWIVLPLHRLLKPLLKG